MNKYNIEDLESERQNDVKVCGMNATVFKITNKKTNKISYTCRLPLTANKKTKNEAIKELEFLMTMVKRMKK
jgi:hypothetical protein